MNCPECGSEETTQIEMKLAGDLAVQFFSCRVCESRWWEKEGDTIALDEVLNLAAAEKKGTEAKSP
jgi:transposase-like protein